MKPIFLMLACSLSLIGCTHKKTVEQQQEEYNYMQRCYSKHMADEKYSDCKKQFKDKYGYPYKLPNSDLDK